MTDYIASDWIENTGTVPAGVGPDTRVEVEYRDGDLMVWGPSETIRNDDAVVWAFDGNARDVIRFRFIETPAERDARLLRGIGELLDAGRVFKQAGRAGE